MLFRLFRRARARSSSPSSRAPIVPANAFRFGREVSMLRRNLCFGASAPHWGSDHLGVSVLLEVS